MIFSKPEKEKLLKGCQQLGVEATQQQIEDLLLFAQLVVKWNKVYNLTAITKSMGVITHHLLDCLSVLPFMNKTVFKQSEVRLLDVGSGAGFPGLVISIMRPNVHVVVLDAVQKKAAFLQQAVGVLKLVNTTVVHARVERYNYESGFDCIISRAFSSIPDFLACSSHLLAAKGIYIALKGQKIEHDQFDDGFKVIAEEKLCVPFLDETRHVYQITR